MKTNEQIMAGLRQRKEEYHMNRKVHIKKLTVCMASFMLAFIIVGSSMLILGKSIVSDTGDDGMLKPIYTNSAPVVLGTKAPVRKGTNSLSASFARKYDLAEAYDSADIVAEIVLTEWLDETEWTTHFTAVVVNLYKDEIGFAEKYPDGKIVFDQAGTSRGIFDDFPIYEVGTRLFVCLRHMDFSNSDIECHRDCFDAVGEQQTELELVEYNGKTLAIRSGRFDNFRDVTSSLSTYETIEARLEFFKDHKYSNNNFVILSIDDVLSYLYSVEHAEE